MEYYNNILCVEGGWLYKPESEGGSGIMTKACYDQLIHRKRMDRLHVGGNGRKALIRFDSIPTVYKQLIVTSFGDPYKTTKQSQFTSHITPDFKAKNFFDNFMKPNGEYLSTERRNNYYNNVIILNAIHEIRNNRKAMRKALGGRSTSMWEDLSKIVNELDTTAYPHTLPGNFRRLQDKFNDYIKDGCIALVHDGLGNTNTRKVDATLERLLISLYCMDNRPFAKWIIDYYLQFISGGIDVVDKETGELFNRADFFDKNGDPIIIGESTAWNYINKPNNQAIIKKLRSSSIDYNTVEMPFNHRHRPNFSLSKISFDDRTLPRKAMDGTWVQSYYAYDPMSECFVGTAYSKDKDTNLIFDCFRDLYANCIRYDLVWPAEAEVEHHLMEGITDQLQTMFAFVHFCNPQNSREKRAEHGIKSKKYGAEKMEQNNIGRWTNRHDAYQVNEDKVEKLTREQLIADDRQSVATHNHQLHSKQKLFPGKTRWQVLMENQNPELSKPQKRILFKYIGFCTKTSIRHNDFVRAQHADYAIETTNILARLKPNNKEVQAYWVPSENGDIPEVYLYQDETYLCHATKIEKYNEALAERTERDEEIRVDQAKRQSVRRKEVKDQIAVKIAKVQVIKNNMDYASIKPVPIPVIPDFDVNNTWELDDDDYIGKALDY